MDKMKILRDRFAGYGFLRTAYTFFVAFKQDYNFNIFAFSRDMSSFLKDYNNYKKKNNQNFVLSGKYLLPYLKDKTFCTLVDPVYFFQDSWAAGKLFRLKPSHHYDVGSSVKTLGIISQFVPVTMVDIRPIEITLNNFYFRKGSILNLPFDDNSIDSLSSLCVVEHVGLGRYGDPIDAFGSEKAIQELRRVLKSGGHMLFSIPVDEECRVYFNAHRAFTREYIMDLFKGMRLVEEKYIYGKTVQEIYDSSKGFGTGLFHFQKL